MERRTFLRRLGLGAGATVALGTPGVVAGEIHAGKRLRGQFDAKVAAKRGRGQATIWWSATTEEKVLGLTFDDGPTERFTAAVLDVLDDYAVPATFFTVGAAVERLPELVQRAAEAGHEIANHTYDHVPAERQGRDEVLRSVERGADAVAEVLGARPRWFRPVRGNVTGPVVAAAAQVGHDIAIWSVTRGAWKDGLQANAESVRETIPKRAHPGAVVLLHDGIGRASFAGPSRPDLVARRDAELLALPDVVESLLADGYRFSTLSDLIVPTPA